MSPPSLEMRHCSFCRFLRQRSVARSHTLPWFVQRGSSSQYVPSAESVLQRHSTHLWSLASPAAPRWQILPFDVAWSGQQSASASQPSTQLSATQRAPFSFGLLLGSTKVDPMIRYSQWLLSVHCTQAPSVGPVTKGMVVPLASQCS